MLFLIPVAWVGPVLAPIICFLTMIFIGTATIYIKEKCGILLKGKPFDWILVFVGAFIIYLTFTWDFTKIIITGGFVKKFFNLTTDPKFMQVVSSYQPKHFMWLIFMIGEVLILFSFFKVYLSIEKRRE